MDRELEKHETVLPPTDNASSMQRADAFNYFIVALRKLGLFGEGVMSLCHYEKLKGVRVNNGEVMKVCIRIFVNEA